MNNIVISTIEKYSMLEIGDSIIVALSGGADSVSLLHILVSIKDTYQLNVYAAHLNHNIRGQEAKRDEDFCRNICESLNVKLFIKSVDVPKLSKEQKISEELCGRNERYKFFEELSQSLNAKIATAHTASDNAETLIFNLSRGSALKGMTGIPPKRGNIIRPLICATRADIENYCKNRGIKFVTDSSNLSDDYTRNKIRHRIIPELKSLNPQFEKAICNLSENFREVSDFMNRESEKAIDNCKLKFGYDCKKLMLLDRAVLKNCLVMMCRNFADFIPENKHIDLMISIIENGGSVNLNNSLLAISKQGIFRLALTENNLCEISDYLKINNTLLFGNKIISTVVIDADNNNCNSISSDYVGRAEFRTRRAGDKFTYRYRKVTKPLRKVLGEMKIPSEIRDNLLVLAVDSTVLWCENVGVSAQAKNNSLDEILIEVV